MPAVSEKLSILADLSDIPEAALSVLRGIATTDHERAALAELETICDLLSATDVYDSVRIDFSVVNNMNYYDGVVFRGFLEGLSEGVLAGGEYGGLLRKMGRSASAVGFAIYLDLLEELEDEMPEYDVDALIVYGADTPASAVAEKKEELVARGLSVTALRNVPAELRYREKYEV